MFPPSIILKILYLKLISENLYFSNLMLMLRKKVFKIFEIDETNKKFGRRFQVSQSISQTLEMTSFNLNINLF